MTTSTESIENEIKKLNAELEEVSKSLSRLEGRREQLLLRLEAMKISQNKLDGALKITRAEILKLEGDINKLYDEIVEKVEVFNES